MLIALHRKRLVSTLVHMAQSRIAPVLLPLPHMGDCQPLHELHNSPSHSGHKSRCQWFGITVYAQIRIGDSSRLSRNTCANAWSSAAFSTSPAFYNKGEKPSVR